MKLLHKWVSGGTLCLYMLAAPAGPGWAGPCADTDATTLWVGCVAADSKVALPEGVCGLFINGLGKDHPKKDLQIVAFGQDADVVLVINHASARTFMARIDWGEVPGTTLATSRAGKPLDTAAIAAFLQKLIAATPRP